MIENFDFEFKISNEELKEACIKIVYQEQTPDGLFYDKTYDEYVTVDNAIRMLDIIFDTANSLNFNIVMNTDIGLAIKFSKESAKKLFDKGYISNDIYNRYLSKLYETVEQYKTALS